MEHPDFNLPIPHENPQNVTWGPLPQETLSGSIHPGSFTHIPSPLLPDLLNLLSVSFKAALLSHNHICHFIALYI